jgi:hypothetical protein
MSESDLLWLFLCALSVISGLRFLAFVVREVRLELEFRRKFEQDKQGTYERWSALRRRLFPTQEEDIQDIIDEIKGG